MRKTKMSAEEISDYYRRVHQEALLRDADDSLGPVIGPNASDLVNRFTDFAHRLGMRRAFGFIEREWGSFVGRAVLDLGCGRGRWAKEYSSRGAEVTGADISLDAISWLTTEMPQHHFISRDIAALEFPDQSFDVVNSVTVMQHMPHWKQHVTLGLISRWVKRCGYVVLLENILALDEPHVFPHSSEKWIEMAQATGLECVYCCGSNFEVLFRVQGYISHRVCVSGTAKRTASYSIAPVRPRSGANRIKVGAKSFLAAASFPLEWACQKVPLVRPTHRVMIFRKQQLC